MKHRGAWTAAAMFAFALGGRAYAHHAAGLFDQSKLVTVTGTVKAFQYTNPHSWLLLTVNDGKGGETQWSFETEGPSTLQRAGVNKNSLKPGDKVTVTGRPLRDGRKAASLVQVTYPDGRTLVPTPR